MDNRVNYPTYPTNTIVVGSVAIISAIILLLLIIIGIVTFNAYMFVVADNGLQLGAGGDVSVFKQNKMKNQRRYAARANSSNYSQTEGSAFN